VCAPSDSAKRLCCLHEACRRPSFDLDPIAPAFDVSADLADGAVHVLDDVGAGQRPAQFDRQAKAGDGEDFVDALQDAGADARGLAFEAAGEVGSVARFHYSVMGAGWLPHEIEPTAEALAGLLKEDAVNAVLLSPV